LGAPLPAPNEELPEDIEVQLSRLVADAGRQLTQNNQQKAAQQKAQQQAQDPLIQMQKQELQIKAQEVQRKAAKDQADVQIRREQVKAQTAKNMSDAVLEAEKVKLDRAELAIEAEQKGANITRAMNDAEDKMNLELLRVSRERDRSR
jgi:hypothetical protein